MKLSIYSKNALQLVVVLFVLTGSIQHTMAQCGSVSTYLPSISSTNVCSQNQVYLSASGLPVSNWIYRDNNTGAWQVFAYNSENGSQYVFVTTATTRTYKAVVSTLSCASDTTLGVTVNLSPLSFGNNPSVKLSATATQVCSGSQVTLNMMNQGVQLTQWLYRDNGGLWTIYSYTSSQSITVTMPNTNIALVRDYRVLITNNSNCSIDSSDILSINVSPSVSGNNLTISPTATSNTVCGGSYFTLQTDWPLEIGNWMYKDAGSNTWTTFTTGGTTSYDYYTDVPTSRIREYRVILKNAATCSADTSGAFSLQINASQRRVLNSIQPRLAVVNNQQCAGSSMSFQVLGYNNSQNWIYRDSINGPWTYFSSSTYPTLYTQNTITQTINREVRVVINNSSSTCTYDTSAPVFYTIKPLVKGNTSIAIPFTTNTEMCVGATPSIYLQNGQTITAWLYRNNNTGAWQNTNNTGNTFTDYNTTNFTTNTARSYKAIISNNTTCRLDSTNEIQILFKIATVGGAIDITPTITQNAVCAGTYITGNISINTNNRQIVKWIYRDNNTGTWLDIAYSNNTYFYDYNTNATVTTLRSYKALVRTFETFKIDTSVAVSVTINPLSRGVLAITPTASIASICNDNSVAVSVIPAAGYASNNWIYRDTITSNWLSTGYNSTTLSNYVSTQNTRRIYRAILLNATLCKYDTTNALTILVNKKSARNNTSYLPTTTTASICSKTALSLAINISNGSSVLRWVYRDNTSAWKEIFNSSTNYYESENNTRVLVSTVRQYKAIINDNNNCFNDTSAAVSVTINPLGNGATSGITPTVTSPIMCSGSSAYSVNFNYNGTVQKWVYRDNGTSWKEFTSGTSSTYLYDYNAYVNTVTNREYRAYLVRQNSCLIDTTQPVSIQIRPYTYGNALAVQPATSAASICSGNTFNTSINYGNGYSVHKWIVKNGLGMWTDIANSTNSNTLYEYNTQVATNILRSYKAIILTNTCSYDTTEQVNVQLNARTYGYATAVTVTSSNGVYCSASNINLNVASSLPSGLAIRNWLYMDNMSNNWTGIPNNNFTSITHTNTAVASTTARSYRVLLNNTNTCSYDSSGIFSVTINPSVSSYAGSITPTISTNTICNATTNPNLNVSLPSGYTIQKWVVNNNGTGWTDFGYPTNSTYVTDYNTSVQNTVNRSYRAIVNNNNVCSIDSTNIVSATISPINNGVINSVTPTSNRNNYCYTKIINASINVPSGYVIEKWIFNDNNLGWQDFNFNTNSSFINDNNTFVSVITSRSYRVILTNNTTCQRDTTSALTVTINARNSSISLRNILPTANPSLGICSGSSVTLNTTTGTGNELFKWIYSDNGNNGPWYDALGSYNATSFSHQLTQTNNTSITRRYRAIITDTSTCDFDSTQTLIVPISPITFGVDTSLSITGADSVCVGTAVSLFISPGSGNSVNKWIFKDNNGPWQNFANSTQNNSLYDGNTSIAPGSKRVYTPLVFKTSACRIDTLTKAKSVYFKNKTYGNSLIAITITTDTVCAGNTINASTSGSVERWLFKDGQAGSWISFNYASTYLSHSETSVTSSGWRYYKALFNTGTCNADSSKTDSVYIKIQGVGNNNVTPTTANSTVCAGNAVTINLSLPNATMQRWIYRDNNAGEWAVLNYTGNFSITDYNTAVSISTTRAYRAIVFRNCSYDTTNALTITITPKTRGVDITKIPTAQNTSVCASSAIQNIQVNAGSGNTIEQWLVRDNGGAWKQFSYGNQNYLTDYNTYFGTTVTRNYAAIINNNSTCKMDTSAVLVVTINPVILGNSSIMPSASTACMGSNYSVSLNVNSDTTIVRFVSNYNGGAWTDEGFINPSTTVSLNRYAYSSSPYTIGYRAITYKASNCHIDTSAAVLVAVTPRTFGNDNGIIPSGNATTCSGNNFTINVSPGANNTISHWVYSDDNINWTPYYTTSTSVNFNAVTNTTLQRKYRALIIKANVCSIDTSAAKTITIDAIQYGTDSVALITISNGSNACIGSQINVSTNPGSNTVNKWLYKDNGFNWAPMYQAGSSIGDLNTFVNVSTNRIYTAIIWKQIGCKLDTVLNTDTINISPRTIGTDNTITITPSATSICTGTPINLNASVGTHNVQNWYYRNNGGAWIALSSNSLSFITDYNTSVSAATTKDYMAIIRKSNACALDTSAIASVVINPRNIGNDNSIIPTANTTSACSGNIISLTVNPGSNNTIIKWIRKENNGAWVDFAYATNAYDYYTTVLAATTRVYRVIIQKGSGCTIDTSAAVTVTINPLGYANQNTILPVASKNNVCSGSAITLSVNGFIGSSVLQWLTRNNNTGTWNVINSSATSITDFNTQTAVATTRQYRAIVNNNVNCSKDTTAEVSVNINPLLNGTIATPTQVSQATVCSGSPVNVFINPVLGSTVKSWLYKQGSIPWEVFNTTSATSVNDFNTTVTNNTTRQYRAIVQNVAGCSLDSSALITVNINVITASTNLAIIPNTTTPSICSGTTATVSVSGFSGTIVTWLFKDSVTDNWTVINNNNFTLFHTNTFVSYPRVRSYRAIVYNANNCSNDSTAVVQLQINPQLAGNANTIVPLATNTTACNGGNVTITASGFINGGTVIGWVYNDNSTNWVRIIGAIGTSLNHNISVTGLTTRQYRALVVTGCNTDTTAPVNITLDRFPTKPLITAAVSTDSLISSETASTYQWLLNGNLIPNATNKVYVATVSGIYKVEIGNTAGCKTISDDYNHSLVGIPNVFAHTIISLYPNPTTSGLVNIDWQGLNANKVKFIIMDLLGKIVLEQEIDSDVNGGTSIDLSPYNSGLYFVTMSAEGNSITQKVLFTK